MMSQPIITFWEEVNKYSIVFGKNGGGNGFKILGMMERKMS